MIERPIHLELAHRVEFTRNLFSPENSVLADVIAKSDGDCPHRVIAFVDGGVVGGISAEAAFKLPFFEFKSPPFFDKLFNHI